MWGKMNHVQTRNSMSEWYMFMLFILLQSDLLCLDGAIYLVSVLVSSQNVDKPKLNRCNEAIFFNAISTKYR